MPHTFNFTSLPDSIAQEFLKTRVATHVGSHRKAVKSFNGAPDLFTKKPDSQPEVCYRVDPVIWATDNYECKGKKYGFKKPIKDLSVITPRIEKSKEIQKLRTKEKAEVFTPSWVCNLQNNLIDDDSVYPGAFNKVDTENGIEGQKTWIPNPNPVFDKLKEEELEKAVEYIMARRLEATCGEAPYLVSRYDTVSGDFIPVINENNEYMRIGLLDRKFRVVNEIANNKEEWITLAVEAVKATYGYEWQGDNLLLARLNIFNSFIEYFESFFGEEETQFLTDSLPIEVQTNINEDSHLLLRIADIISWNIWQMDGLKMVIPMSCVTEDKDMSKNCSRCAKVGFTQNTDKYNFHNGDLAVIRWGDKVIAFEDFLINAKTPNATILKDRKEKNQTSDIENVNNADSENSSGPIPPKLSKKPVKKQNSFVFGTGS